MDYTHIDWVRVNKLLDKNITRENLNKRLYRDKSKGYYEEYLALCLVKGKLNFESSVKGSTPDE